MAVGNIFRMTRHQTHRPYFEAANSLGENPKTRAADGAEAGSDCREATSSPTAKRGRNAEWSRVGTESERERVVTNLWQLSTKHTGKSPSPKGKGRRLRFRGRKTEDDPSVRRRAPCEGPSARASGEEWVNEPSTEPMEGSCFARTIGVTVRSEGCV